MATTSAQPARAAPRAPTFRALERGLRRIAADSHVLLAVGLAIPTILVQLIDVNRGIDSVVLVSILYVALQVGLSLGATHRGPLRGLATPTARIAWAVLFVTIVSSTTSGPSFSPLSALYVPVLAMAAAMGSRELSIAALLALTGFVASMAFTGVEIVHGVQRGVALLGVTIVLAIGTRRTVGSLEESLGRLRQTMAHARRRNRQVAAVEAVGRTLALRGPDDEALDRVMDLLHRDLGYSHVSIYLVAGPGMLLHLGAQRGYDEPIEWFDGTRGVIGRAARSREVQFVRDVTADPDFIGVAPALTAEICAPLVTGDVLLGIVNVETDSEGLDETDLEVVLLVADRLATALALAAQRRDLADRVEVFQRLIEFASQVSSSLDPDTRYRAIADKVGQVIPVMTAVVTVLDRTTGQYRIRALSPLNERIVGMEVKPGEGVAGRAIRDRALVVDDAYRHVPERGKPVTVKAAAIPLIREAVVVGALSLVRNADDETFSPLELEVLSLVAAQAGLAIANSFLHADITELSIRDPLTGLYNRRHLDASLERMMALRQRRPVTERGLVSVIMFDLDLFGAFNKLHGHQIGDNVLRTFANLIRERFRAADLVARYGGEEFVAVLEGATLEDTVKVADAVRREWSERIHPGADGGSLRATVSAGCAALEPESTSIDPLFAAADVGLAMAKHAGRNRVVAA